MLNIKNLWVYCTVAIAALLAIGLSTQIRGDRRNIEGEGTVFVYYASECASAGDASNCQQLPGDLPAFQTMAACSAHAARELNAVQDPKRMASCEKMRES